MLFKGSPLTIMYELVRTRFENIFPGNCINIQPIPVPEKAALAATADMSAQCIEFCRIDPRG